MGRKPRMNITRNFLKLADIPLKIPRYFLAHPVKAPLKVMKYAVIGTAVAAAALYAYSTFSPRYHPGASIRSGIERVIGNAGDAFSDAKNAGNSLVGNDISDYVSGNENQEYKK